jgi:hypothetical protein
MGYRITHAGPAGVRIRRTASAMAIPVVGTLIGALFIIVGVGMGLTSGWSLESGTFAAGGAFFASLPWVVISNITRLQADELQFDNASACCYLLGKAGVPTERGVIPYSSIAEFGYTTRAETMLTSGTMLPISRTVHDVCFFGTDGSTFVLLAGMPTVARAAAYVTFLQQHVQLTNAPTSVAIADLPASIHREQTAEVTEFHWRNAVPVGAVIVSVLVFAGFFALLYVLANFPGTDATFRLLARIMGVVAMIIVSVAIVSAWRSRGGHRFVRISNDALTIGRTDARGVAAVLATVPLADVLGVGADFALDGSTHRLTVRTVAYAERLAPLRQRVDAAEWTDKLRAAWQAALLDTTLPRIEAGLIPLLSLLQLENHLTLEIARRKGEPSVLRVGEVTAAAIASESKSLAPDGSLQQRLTSNATLGVASLLAAGLPLLGAVIAVLVHRPGRPVLLTVAAQILVGAAAAWKLWRHTAHRWLGAATLAAAVAGWATFAYPALSVYVLPVSLVLCCTMALTGARLLLTPELTPDELGDR